MILKNPYEKMLRKIRIIFVFFFMIFLISLYALTKEVNASYPVFYLSLIILGTAMIFLVLFSKRKKWAQEVIEQNTYLGTLHLGKETEKEQRTEQGADRFIKRGCSGALWLLFSLIGGIFFLLNPSDDMQLFFLILFFVGAMIFFSVYLISGFEAKKSIVTEIHFFDVGFMEEDSVVVFDGKYIRFIAAEFEKNQTSSAKLLLRYNMPIGRGLQRSDVIKEIKVRQEEEEIAKRILNSLTKR
ncbi:MAG: hypothetical protein JW708_09835 [Vallitaleaceae bacterium]|nr:hypothetical protein [Vallitaleaceae bacterium]